MKKVTTQGKALVVTLTERKFIKTYQNHLQQLSGKCVKEVQY